MRQTCERYDMARYTLWKPLRPDLHGPSPPTKPRAEEAVQKVPVYRNVSTRPIPGRGPPRPRYHRRERPCRTSHVRLSVPTACKMKSPDYYLLAHLGAARMPHDDHYSVRMLLA